MFYFPFFFWVFFQLVFFICHFSPLTSVYIVTPAYDPNHDHEPHCSPENQVPGNGHVWAKLVYISNEIKKPVRLHDVTIFSDCERREKLQLTAARIVSGLPIIASKESLYFETGRDPLSTRRKISKLKTMYKIDRNFLLDFSKETYPYIDLQYQKLGKLQHS